MNELEQLQALLAPQIAEQDATAVDVYGLKSKAADDIIQKRKSIVSAISDPNIISRGGKNIFGQETGAFTLEDLSDLIMGTTGGGLKGIGKGIKGLSQKNPTGLFRTKSNKLVSVETRPERLYRELTEGSLDSYEFQEKLYELQQMAPELASEILSGGF